MASVTNNLTRIHDAEGTLTTGNIPSGGAGATANTDIFLQAAQSLGKRITVTGSTEGFALVDAADNDCSASGTHVGIWLWVTHYAIMDDLRVSLSTGTTPSTNYDYHTVPLTEYPALGGWKRVWVHVNRTPSGTAGAGLTESQVRCYGAQVSFSTAPGGNAQNLIIDAADYVTGAALTLTGTSGLWTDFTSADENTSNQYGVFRSVGGVYNCAARIQLGSSGSSLVFDDSNFSVVFPVQSLVQSDWMGVSINLQNASTDINMDGGVFFSASPSGNKGDFVVTGTSGSLTASGLTFNNLRLITLTSVCSVLNSAIIGCGQVTAAGAEMDGCSVSGYEGTANTSALVWDVNTDPDGLLDGMTFTKGTAATHAIEFGTNSPTTMTLTNVTFAGYNSSNNQNDSAIHIKRTTGTVTINIDGGTTPSYRSDGAAVVIVSGTVTATVKAITATGTAIASANVFLAASSGAGPFPYQDTVTIANSGTTATVTHTSHGLATNDKVLIEGASHAANNGVFTITVSDVDTYTYTMGSTPGSNPTGTITSTYVAIKGLTDVNGEISVTRVFPTDQPVSGWARKSSGAPYYKTGAINGVIDSAAGATFSAVLVLDQ